MPHDNMTIPFSQEDICPRPRVDNLLDAAFRKPLIVVHAGAGFGKTTAVSEYLSNTDYRTVWFSCTGQDNIPARFWTHLTRVFTQHRAELGEKNDAS